MPDLKMTALGILYQIRWKSRKTNRPANFIVKETLAEFVSTLEDDDIGYLYDPSRDGMCLHPGELCGKIANSNLPYSFPVHEGVRKLMTTMKGIDEKDYNRFAVIVSDCLDEVLLTLPHLERTDGVSVWLFDIGANEAYRQMCEDLKCQYRRISDATELKDALEDLKKFLSITR